MDFRFAAPVLLVAALLAVLGSPQRYFLLLVACLCVLKLAILPFTVERGLVGDYYASPDFTGPVKQIRRDAVIDFTDGDPPLDFLNDIDTRLTVWRSVDELPQPDFSQMPFSVRWTGYIRGNHVTVETDQAAELTSGSLTYRKGWGPPHLKLQGADGLYSRTYSDGRIRLGDWARIADNAVTLLLLCLLVVGLVTVRLTWNTGLFLGLAIQAYIMALPHQSRTVILTFGDDWTTYETQARDVLQHGLLMNGVSVFAGQPWYFQSFYAYILAGLHWLTGSGPAGIVFVQYLLAASMPGLAYGIARELWDRRVATVAALLFVASEEVYVLPFEARLLAENFALPALLAGLYLFFLHLKTQRTADLVAAALLLGLAADLRAALLAFLPLPPLVLAARRRYAAAGLLVAIVVPELGAVVLRNYLASGQPLLLPTAGATDFHDRFRDRDLSWRTALFIVRTGLDYLFQRPWTSRIVTLQGIGLVLLWLSGPAAAFILRRCFRDWRFACLCALLSEQLIVALAFGPQIAYQFRGELFALAILVLLAAVVLCAAMPRRASAALLAGTLAVAVTGARISNGMQHLLRQGPASSVGPGLAALNADVEIASVTLPPDIHPGQALPVRVLWKVVHSVHASYLVNASIQDPSTGRELFNDWFDNPGLGSLIRIEDEPETQTWRTGDTVSGTLRLRVPEELPSGKYSLELSVYSNQAVNKNPQKVFEAGRAVVPLTVTR